MTAVVDSACGYAAYRLMAAESEVLTTEFSVHMLDPAAGERFGATGRVVRAGRTLTVCEGVFADVAAPERPIAAYDGDADHLSARVLRRDASGSLRDDVLTEGRVRGASLVRPWRSLRSLNSGPSSVHDRSAAENCLGAPLSPGRQQVAPRRRDTPDRGLRRVAPMTSAPLVPRCARGRAHTFITGADAGERESAITPHAYPARMPLLDLSADELLSTTRAVRRRLDLTRPVAREVLEECLALAQQAPTAATARPGTSSSSPTPRSGRRSRSSAALAAAYLDGAAPEGAGRDCGRSVEHLVEHIDGVPVHVIPCIRGRTDGLPAPARGDGGLGRPGGVELHARGARARPRNRAHEFHLATRRKRRRSSASPTTT